MLYNKIGYHMNNLQEYVRNNFDGVFVFGDVHGDYASIKHAYDYAKGENFFFMSLGDLVDRGRYPYETVKLMHDVIHEGRGGLTVGNHDNKMYRYAKGSPVSFSKDATQTLADVGSARHAKFFDMYVNMIDTPIFSGLYHEFDDFIFAHAASHPVIWGDTVTKTRPIKDVCMVGEADGTRDAEGFPIRRYTWIDEIPSGKTVIVGHDRKPINNVSISEPMVVSNAAGGKAAFIDTGCGKGGSLTGAVLMLNTARKFNIVGYKTFS